MFKPSILTSIIDKFMQLPQGLLGDLSEDLKNSLKAHLENTLAKFSLVTREEFDVQTQILRRTQERIQALEAQIETLLTREP